MSESGINIDTAVADEEIAIGKSTGAKDAAKGGGEGPSSGIEIPEELAILPIRDTVAFPGTILPLTIGRKKSQRLLDDVLTGSKVIGLVAQRHADTEDPTLDDLYRVGTVCFVLKLLKQPDGNQSLIVHGVARFGIESIVQTEPYPIAIAHPHFNEIEPSKELDALVHTVRSTAERVIELTPNMPEAASAALSNIEEPGTLADFLAANLSLGLVQKQELLETFDVPGRLKKILVALNSQVEILELSHKLQTEANQQIDASQREYYLHEQLKAIQKELGQADGRTVELDALRTKVEEARMSEAAATEAQRELGRMSRMPQASPEYSVAMDYVEWLCALPWSVSTTDRLDLDAAAAVLDEDHYDLEKVKKRILEFLAVRKLKPDGRGAILCFTGPPGVGKTSLGQSIARALGRKFVRISLGGVRDEADIRGHRRTYIGALPGRIMQELRKCGSNNPVFMLDEVDKMGSDFRGDPAAALLELLDPAQNDSFTDHYLGVAFDLSQAMFIATANYMDPLPPALRDRMEVIELSGYTLEEKRHIARQFIVPRQLAEHGLTEQHLRIDDGALETLIDGYTREAGVRNLERQVGAVCRAVAAKVARGKTSGTKINAKRVAELLGPRQFEPEMAQRTSVAGVVTGLAFTPSGGEIIFVEATEMPGQGQLTLTGQLGDVMRESAQAAYSLVRSRAHELGIRKSKNLTRCDIHIHVPAGAVPKDGPSAGVAMLAALVSLLTGRAARADVAMTGEITLRGLVLPVGGVKEKVLAAHRAGIKTVLLPARNRKDIAELPKHVIEQLRIECISDVDELLSHALAAATRPAKRRPRSAARSGSVKRSQSSSRKAAKR